MFAYPDAQRYRLGSNYAQLPPNRPIAPVYAPYIRREAPRIRQLGQLAEVALPPDLDYGRAPGLSSEAREKLGRARPATLAQAARIPGIDPATLSILRVLSRRGQEAGEARLRP